MKTKNLMSLIGLLGLCFAFSLQPSALFAQGTAFTYQGRLDSSGAPATGLFDFRFSIFDSASGGAAVAGPITNSAVAVSNGLFTTTLNFGGGVFTGPARWLEIAARTNSGGAFTILSSRQPLTPTPYAIFAGGASNLSGTLPASQLSGAITGAQIATGAVGSAQIADGSVSSADIADGTIAAADVNAATFNATFWRVVGNTGTTPGTHFVGTTDNQPLELRVNNLRALRLEPDTTSPNVIGGHSDNIVGSGYYGSIIGGGGTLGNSNAIFAIYATIAGGYRNAIGTDASSSAIGGGYDNNIAANSWAATIAGGYWNAIGTNSYCSAIGGGYSNNIAAYAAYATIPGGHLNFATNYAFAAGRRAKANHTGAFVWGDSTDADIASTNANSVTMRASGGYRLFSNTNATTGVSLAAGGSSWSSISDRNAKENFAPVNVREVLEKVAALPVTTWNYKSQDASIRHIGPMAQDFRAAFGVGESDTGITSIDADGVALAAIQGLNQKLEAENAALKARLEQLERLVQQLVK